MLSIDVVGTIEKWNQFVLLRLVHLWLYLRNQVINHRLLIFFLPIHSPLAQFTRFRPKRGGVSWARNCVLPCRTRILYWLPLPLGNQYYHLKYQGMNFCGVSYLYVNVDYLTECLWTCCLCYLGRFKTLYFEWTYSLVFRWTKCCEAQLRLYVIFFLSSLKLFLRTKSWEIQSIYNSLNTSSLMFFAGQRGWPVFHFL